MPELISTIAIRHLESHAALNAYARRRSAVSDEAQAAQEVATDVIAFTEQSQVLFGYKTAAVSQLWALAAECAEENWDGFGAVGIDENAVLNAEEFVRALPAGVSVPEFAPEPDGSISLDWIESQHRIFSVSVGSGARLAYAWLDGTDRGHAVARFDGLTIPERILDGIREIMSHVHTPVRTF